MDKRFRDSQKVGSILKNIIDNNHLNEGINQILVTESWFKTLGSGIKNYTIEVKLNKNKLTVFLNSAVVREELSYGKEKIIKMLNEDLKQNLIEELILK
jgi:hypothetical protein